MKWLPAIFMFCCAGAAADAAIKAQEGSVDHWIDFYARERARGSADGDSPPAAAAKKIKEDAAAGSQDIGTKK